MPFLVASWLAFTAGAAVNPAQRADVPPISATALPSGSSEQFRTRMVDWNAAPEAAQLRARNQPTDWPSPRLDRLAMSSRFGWRTDPITGVGRRHAGVDLPSRFGSAVMATGPGTVRIAGWAGGYGNLVEIEHAGGVRTRYGHLSRLNVFPSEHVEQGQVIGEIGSTGHSTGPHLHFEVRVHGSAVDPLKFVGQRAPFVSQRAPVIDTVWGGDLHATSKWAWWSGTRGQALPEVSLR